VQPSSLDDDQFQPLVLGGNSRTWWNQGTLKYKYPLPVEPSPSPFHIIAPMRVGMGALAFEPRVAEEKKFVTAMIRRETVKARGSFTVSARVNGNPVGKQFVFFNNATCEFCASEENIPVEINVPAEVSQGDVSFHIVGFGKEAHLAEIAL